MLSKRTVIGLIVGILIIGIGVASLILHIGLITINETNVLGQGDSEFYVIPAPDQTPQRMTVSGDTFDIKLTSPNDGFQIENRTSYSGKQSFDWVHDGDGESTIQIQNTGSSELTITGVFVRSSDPIWFTYDLMVIISGIVIIGFSLGFTLRKPKGF